MAIVFGILLFLAGALVVILAMGTLVLPVFYILPRTIAWFARGWIRWPALARCILLIAVWAGVFLVGAVGTSYLFPNAAAAAASAISWKFGQSVGFVMSLIRLVNRDGRADLRRDFIRGATSYLTEAGSLRAASSMRSA